MANDITANKIPAIDKTANDMAADDKLVNDCCLILIILILPPLGVGLMRGCNADFWINLCLTLFLGLPGLVHAIYLLLKDREKRQHKDRGVEEPPIQPPGYDTVPKQP